MHIQRLARPTEFRQVVVRQRLPEHARREVIPRRRPEERAAVALHNAVVVTCNQTNVSLALSPIDTSTSWVGDRRMVYGVHGGRWYVVERSFSTTLPIQPGKIQSTSIR